MNNITIPDEVVEAAAKAMPEQFDMEDYPDYSRKVIRAAIRAALKAWPDVVYLTTSPQHSLLLPLTQETDA